MNAQGVVGTTGVPEPAVLKSAMFALMKTFDPPRVQGAFQNEARSKGCLVLNVRQPMWFRLPNVDTL